MSIDAATIWLFSYGTLRQADVQRAVFGRLLDGDADTLPGFRLAAVAIDDPDVIASSGSTIHPILVRDPDADRAIGGTALRIVAADLPAVDAYEGSHYVRIEVELTSGRSAFVYVAPEP